MSRPVRIVEAVAALLSAGLLVVAVLLAVLLFAAPALNDGTGPRLDRVLVPLAAGVLGEVVHLRRERFSVRARPWVAGLVIVVVLGALWWGWWR